MNLIKKLDFIQPGYNYRMTEFQAVMGIESLKKLNSVIFSRNKIKNQYINLLTPLGFTPQTLSFGAFHNIQSVIFQVPKDIKRDELILFLSNTTYYKTKYNKVQPNALYLEQNTITLPCYGGVNVKKICKKIEKFILNNI